MQTSLSLREPINGENESGTNYCIPIYRWTVAGVGIDDKSINPAEDVDIGLFSEAEAYENPKFQRFVTRCTWHVAETWSSGSEAFWILSRNA